MHVRTRVRDGINRKRGEIFHISPLAYRAPCFSCRLAAGVEGLKVKNKTKKEDNETGRKRFSFQTGRGISIVNGSRNVLHVT